MRILFLAKRHNMDIDSVGERHGRAYHLPMELSQLGHEVHGLYVDYRTRDSCWARGDGEFDISVCSVRGRWGPRVVPYYRRLREITRDNRPDVVIAGTDALNLVIGKRLARQFGTPFVADVKDDYTAFSMTRKVPFLKSAYYRTLTAADLVICVSEGLEKKLKTKGVNRSIVIENAVPADFAPKMTGAEARSSLGLPAGKFLFGVAGALRSSRDFTTVIQGSQRFLLSNVDAALALAGPRDNDFAIPVKIADQVYDLGQLPPHRVPILFRALDLGLIPNSPGRFGNSCYPQKYNEMVACGLPVGASKVGVFDNGSHAAQEAAFVFNPDQPDDLASHLDAAYKKRARLAPPNVHLDTWSEQVSKLDSFIKGLC